MTLPIPALSNKLRMVLMLSVSIAATSSAQRPPHLPVNSGCFRQSVSVDSVLPIYYKDMDADCIGAYWYLDSICRVHYTRPQLDSIFALINSWDKLSPYLRLKYKITEYDPDLYEEYEIAGNKNS